MGLGLITVHRDGTESHRSLAEAALASRAVFALLVLAALELCEERGYVDTTVIELAETAGLTKSTVVRYFAAVIARIV